MEACTLVASAIEVEHGRRTAMLVSDCGGSGLVDPPAARKDLLLLLLDIMFQPGLVLLGCSCPSVPLAEFFSSATSEVSSCADAEKRSRKFDICQRRIHAN